MLKERIAEILSAPVKSESDKARLRMAGFTKTDNASLVALSLFESAKTGNVTAMKELLNLALPQRDEEEGLFTINIIGLEREEE